MKRNASLSFKTLIALIVLVALPGLAQKTSSVIIHNAGGGSAGDKFSSDLKSALERAKPCVEALDDKDIADALEAERQRQLLEGSDPNAALQALGNQLGSGIVVSVTTTAGPGGTTMIKATAMDPKTGRAVAQQFGDQSTSEQMAASLVSGMGGNLADDCRPHWVGTVRYLASMNETKPTDDEGPAHAGWRNVKRHRDETVNMSTQITASLLPPKPGGGVNSTTARVSQRINFVSTKKQSIAGETLCRERGKNPYFKSFTASYLEITTQIGQGTDVMPVFISLDDDGTYSIKVTAPGGVLYGKFESKRQESGCGENEPDPQIDQVSMPESKFTPTSFDAEGKTSPRDKDHLSGSYTTPDGHTKISWNLRLVRPKK